MLKIATANSRKAKKWKNLELTWDELADRLRKPTVTQESMLDYKKMSKTEKGEVKDVGGFVGGWLKKGKRRVGHLEKRQLLTLDVDFPKEDLLLQFELIYNWKGMVYSTHSHTEKNPRYRLIFLLDREVGAEEYQAVGRKVAEQLGMEQFDPTGFQAERLMYFSSHSRDNTFVFEEFDGKPIAVDDVLAEYPNWQDISFWPLHPDELDIQSRTKKQMEDPTAKTGLIGAFCRVYSISAAIETFLSDTYEPGSKDNRYSYTGGSTSDGLVVYDDLFAYSHHGTDPISGRDVNAYDLVRLHKFGELDGNVRADTKPSNLPSYKKMMALARNDETVQRELSQMALEQAHADFDVIEEEDATVKEKLPKLRISDEGKLKKDPFNLEILLQSDPDLKGRLGYNEFTGIFGKTGQFPWEKEANPDWMDEDTAQLKSLINHRYELLFGDDRIIDTLIVVSQKNRYNPVKDFIRTEEWDGVSRIGDVFIDYLGAEETPYVREVTELWFAAAVARIYKPGCKFDDVPILDGSQGIGKSTLIEKIAGEWFTDSITKLDGNKDDLQLMSRVWLIELGELASMNRTDVDAAKRFISSKEDHYRAPYGRRPIVQKRNSVFIGTTNSDGYLKDLTGNRRWLPITCSAYRQTKSVFDGSLDKMIPQLWAEAYELYRTRYKYGNWLVLSDGSKLMAKEAQTEAEAPDVTKEKVLNYLAIPKPSDWHDWSRNRQREYIQWQDAGELTGETFANEDVSEQLVTYSKEIYEVYFEGYLFEGRSHQANSERRKIGTILTNLPGWDRDRAYIQGKQERVYVKKVPIEENMRS